MFLRTKLIFLLCIFAFLHNSGLRAQEPKPLPPSFDVLTINPEDGHPTLSWTPPSYNPLHPEPTGYIIYIPTDIGNLAIDTVDAETLTYTDLERTGNESSLQYTIASDGPTEPSQLTTPHGSIHLTAKYDSCGNKLDIRWNHYVGWGNRIDEYYVYISQSPNLNSFTLVDTVPGNQNLFYYTIPPNQEYYLYVEAKKRDADTYSKSNMAFVNTQISKPPDFVSIDSIIAKDRLTELHFKIDNSTEYRNFTITRWEYSDSISSIFTAKKLFSFTDPTTVFFSDTTDSWTARSRPFYFKINAYDGCNRLKRVSNLSNSLIVRALSRGQTTTISWDPFYSAEANPIVYKLYRVTFNPNPNTPELIFEEENPYEMSYDDNHNQFEGQGYLPQFCYYVEAHEILAGSQKVRISRSRTICTEITPTINMPNAIDPKSTIIRDNIPRNIFAPTLSFVATYKLIIYNRWGGVVFQGNNKGWDGRLNNGDYASEGAYIYRLEVYTESKRMTTKTGTVNVVYGPN
ncbi:MAG: gliding motility-associated C-terminal domain-containing protein [Bacteroidales bacterium]